MKARITEPPDEKTLETWNQWCSNHAPVHFFQHPAFARLVNESAVYQQGLAVAISEGGTWSATVSYVLLHEHGRAFKTLTTRAVIYGGPVFASNLSEAEKLTAADAILASLTKHLKSRCLFIQFRNFSDSSALETVFKSHGFRFTDRLNLQKPIASPDEAWLAVSPSRRRQIRQSRENGLQIRPARNLQEVTRFYGLLKQLYRDKVRKPLPAESLFRQFFLLTRSQACGHLLIAEYRGDIAGGILAPLTPGDSIFEWYVCGLDREYQSRKIYPSAALTWAAMEAGIAAACHTFDFMGMGLPHIPYGVRDFKARFGGNWVNHGRWLRINAPFSYRLIEIAYNLMRKLKKV